jgi:hypothetical protein
MERGAPRRLRGGAARSNFQGHAPCFIAQRITRPLPSRLKERGIDAASILVFFLLLARSGQLVARRLASILLSW